MYPLRMKSFYPSFRTRIFIFYIIFGLTPMLIISYYSFNTASKSILEISQNQISELVKNIASQTDDFYKKTVDDIKQLSENPLIQLAFLQFYYGQRMDAVRDRLSIYRTNSETYHKISLYNKELSEIISVPQEDIPSVEITKGVLAEALNKDFSTLSSDKYIYILKRVYDFENSTAPVGVIIFQIENRKFTRFLENIVFSEDTVKLITSKAGTIYSRNTLKEHIRYGYFKADVKSLDWIIAVNLPESFLFKNITKLKNKTLLFVFTTTILALLAAVYFTDKLMTPIKKVIKGTKEFAKGNFNYRIDIRRGREIKMLADSFNNMAENIEKRQNELIQTNKLAALGLLSAGIAHEVKNPLAAIKTTAQVIQKKSTGNDVILGLSTSIVQETDRLSGTVSDMLNFARPNPANIEIFNIRDAVEYVINMLHKEFLEKNIKINTDIDNIDIKADVGQFKQIILNLVINAVRAMDKKIGIINIYTEKKKYLNLIIEDNGRGISEKYLSNIFDPFFSMTPDGTGLGLSVVFTLLKQNNMDIDVSSEENAGTKISIIIKEVV